VKVTKRDGTIEDFDADKLNKWAAWASETCGVSWSDVILEASRQLHDSVNTTDIHKTLIEVCVNRQDTGHSRMAARLFVGQIYKEAFEDFSIPSLSEFYNQMVELGYWDDLAYTEEELQILDSVIDHTKDLTYEYCTIRQFYDKYAVSAYGRCMESPQMALMGMAMSNTRNESNRVESVKSLYEKLSMLKINLPTPSLSGQRTPTAGSPSCCLISGKDSVDSIEAAVHVAYKMTALSSGIGAELEIRGPQDPVKGGTIEHQGKLAYYRYLDRAVKANRQHSRGGSATVTFTCLDPEVETLLRLKSQRVHPEMRIDSMDYSLAINNTFLKRVAKDEDWVLVSNHFAPKLYALMYGEDDEAFEKELENVITFGMKKQVVKARTIVNLFFSQRSDTGRIYLTNLSNINKHTPFKESIRMSNLCQEVLLVTKGFENVQELYKEESEGEVALCFLASIVAGRVSLEEWEDVAYETCKVVDNTIDQSTYPFPSVEKSAKARRSIGIGVTNVAAWMAENGFKYDTEEGRNAIHRLAEMHSYSLHKASVRLAKERGKCEWFHKTKYADEKPWLPIDTYAKDVDGVHSQELLCDWEGLREDIRKYGMRFSVLEAHMPVESSSVFTASTNGWYPVRDLKIFKKSKKGTVYFEAPGLEKFGKNYQNAYDIESLDMVKVYAIIQKFTGQGISADFYQRVNGSDKISMASQYKTLLFSGKAGMKTWYYLNSETNTSLDESEESGCDSCTL